MTLSAPLQPAGSLDGIAAAAASLGKPALPIIDGHETAAGSGRTFDNISSRDGTLINRIAACDAADVGRAVASARTAFEDGRWRDLAPRARKAILHAFADLMQVHAENLALLESLDTGKPIHDARAVDIPLAIGTVRYYAEAVDKVYGEVAPTPSDRLCYAVHEPLGVIGAIVPWNFPLHMAMWKVAPALA
ncbi:MAG: aldehyde dehydrogenase family protein, partial [Asticcacaulis sp.]